VGSCAGVVASWGIRGGVGSLLWGWRGEGGSLKTWLKNACWSVFVVRFGLSVDSCLSGG